MEKYLVNAFLPELLAVMGEEPAYGLVFPV